MRAFWRGLDDIRARILGVDDAGVYEAALLQAARTFGEDSAAYRSIARGIDVGHARGAQYFWVTHLNGCLPVTQGIISLEAMERIYCRDKTFFKGYYAFLPELVLRSEIPLHEDERPVLIDLVEQVWARGYVFSPENPLRIRGLELVGDDDPLNEFGLLLRFGRDTHAMNDHRFACSNDASKIAFGRKKMRLWAARDGLSGICLGAGASLYSDAGLGVYTDCICRVVVHDS